MDIGKVIQRVSDYIDQKHMKKEGELVSNTNKNYCSALRMFLYAPQHRQFTHLKDISDEVVLQYLLSIPGRSNRCTHHSAIKMMFRLHGFPNKMRFVPYPDKEDRLPVHVNIQEFVAMVSVCENTKHRAIISIMFDCGLRVSEVVGLKLSDLDISNMIVNVRQSKGKKDRKIKMSGVLLSVLQHYISEYTPTNYLFEGQKKDQYTSRSCQEVVKQLCAKAGIDKKFSPHKFRHGYAMALLENGTTLSEIKDQMGHESEKTTAIYARMNNKVIQKIESPMEQIMRGSGNITLQIPQPLAPPSLAAIPARPQGC